MDERTDRREDDGQSYPSMLLCFTDATIMKSIDAESGVDNTCNVPKDAEYSAEDHFQKN